MRKLLIITSLYSVYYMYMYMYMYMYCSYFIIQKMSFLYRAAASDKIRILDLLLKSGANCSVQDGVSDYILIVIHM